MRNEWKEFKGGRWETEIDVRDFIMNNYTPYDGDDSFLKGPTADTTALWNEVLELSKKEREAGGVLDMDTKVVSTILSHGPGYLDKEKETIVGFQTDKPFKRALMPYGGIRMAKQACEDNGYHLDPEVEEFFTTHRKTHNAGVFDAYTPEMRACRSSHVITGLPDAYGRGRIIGDYRRVALYGVDRLIEDKEFQKATTPSVMLADVIRDREELSEQIRALKEQKEPHEESNSGIIEIDELLAYMHARQEKPDEESKMPPGMEELFFDFARRVETLTPMERTVLQYYINGFSVNEIAEKEFISLSTVRKHNSNINRKLGVSTREELLLYIDMFRRCDLMEKIAYCTDTEKKKSEG